LYSSDMGPDQKVFRKIVTGHCVQMGELYELVICTHCFFHSEELIVRTGLTLIDTWLAGVCSQVEEDAEPERPWKYYSTLSKAIHIWREAPRNFFKVWNRLYTALEGVAAAKALPPRCIAGRWGSITATEERLIGPPEGDGLRRGRARLDQLVEVFKAVLRPRPLAVVAGGMQCQCKAAIRPPAPGPTSLLSLSLRRLR
jgi:hypothetical protein